MAVVPLTLQESARAMLRVGARALVRALRAFPHLVDKAIEYGLPEHEIRAICADEGLTPHQMREYLGEVAL